MHVLIACDRYFGDAPGGAWRIAWDLARMASRDGHQVTMLCGSTDADPPAGRAEVEGVELVRYRFPRLGAWDPRRWTAHVEAARAAAAAHLAGRRWDVVHGHSPASATGAWRACGAAARLVYTVHSPAALEQRINWSDGTLAGRLKLALGLPAINRAEGALLAAASRVHVLSEYTRSELRRLHGPGLDRKFVHIPWWAPAGVAEDRIEARRALGWPAEAFTFFSLRRLVRRMGLDLLVEAVARLEVGRTVFVAIGGQGPERQALESRVAALGLQDRVRLLGPLSEAEVRLAYSACDAFVLPTRELECFGIIAVEALAYGRPVVGAAVGAIPEVIEPQLPGWLFKAGDGPDLARVLGEVLAGRLVSPAPDRLRADAEARFGQATLGPRYRRLLAEAAEP